MRWVGLDLHEHYITACALDDAGQIVAEHRRLPPDVEALTAWLAGPGDPVTVAMEATLYWAWLHDRLSAAGIAAVAAHPYQVKLLQASRSRFGDPLSDPDRPLPAGLRRERLEARPQVEAHSETAQPEKRLKVTPQARGFAASRAASHLEFVRCLPRACG
jgi:hypothetical protein